MPRQLRQLFSSLCIFCNPQSPRKLWEKYSWDLSEDYYNTSVASADYEKKESAKNRALLEIEALLNVHGVSCETLDLPKTVPYEEATRCTQELEIGCNNKIATALQKIASLNRKQKEAFDQIVKAIESTENEEQRSFYLDGPGGTGKTYLYNTLINYIQGNGGKVLSFATTGDIKVFITHTKILFKQIYTYIYVK